MSMPDTLRQFKAEIFKQLFGWFGLLDLKRRRVKSMNRKLTRHFAFVFQIDIVQLRRFD